MRTRVLIFLAVLMLDAAFVRTNPLAMGIGVAAYLVVVLPAIGKGR